MTLTADLAKCGLLDTDREPTNNDLGPTPVDDDLDDGGGDRPDGGCEYCGRGPADHTDPFSLRGVCVRCWNLIVTGEPSDEPWHCGVVT